MSLGSLIRDVFTGTTNKHYDLGRIAWALTILAGIVYQGIALAFKNQVFSVTDFGTGMGIILAAGGVGVAAKDLANPTNRKTNVTVEGDLTGDVQAGPEGTVNVKGTP